MHQSGMGLRQLARVDAQLLQFAFTVVVDYDVGVVQQPVDVGLSGVLRQIQPGASRSDVGLEVHPVVLEVVRAGGAQYVGALLGQHSSHRGAGHGVSERQHPHAAERSFGRAQRTGRRVADAGEPDNGLAGQQCPVRMRQPLLGASGHARR
jgi:hypothetical protein